MTKREPGFYWVKQGPRFNYDHTEWVVSRWYVSGEMSFWMFIDGDTGADEDLTVIGPKIEPPKE